MASIQRLRLSGWMPFAGDFDLALPPAPIAVVARYQSNPRRSNMAGKTALMEAITWCLYGVHRKRTDDAVINGRVEECFVELSFDDLVVKRVKKRGSATVLTVRSGAETRRGNAAQQLLVERLAEGLDDYQATANFSQGDIESLVGMKTSKRREVISGWLRLERWSLAGKKASERLRAVTSKHREIEAVAKAVSAKAMSPEDEKRLRPDFERTVKKLGELKARLPEMDQALIELGDPSNIASEFATLNRLRGEATELRSVLMGRADLNAASARITEHHDSAQRRLQEAETELGKLKRIRESGFDGTCPVMCAACPVEDVVTKRVKNDYDLFAGANIDAQLARKAYSTARLGLVDVQGQIKELDRAAATLASVVKQGKEIVSRVGKHTAESVEALRKRQNELRAERSALLNAIATETQREAILRSGLMQSEALVEQRARHELELETTAREARVASLMAQALSPAGIPAMIARSHVERLEGAANGLLADSGLSLEFAWQRETKDLAPTCSSCGFVYAGQRDRECPGCGASRGQKLAEDLEILVDDGSGEIEDVRMKSGGARVLVASALRLAASAMLREVRGTPVGWATIDEPFGPLDEQNREHLARVFGGMLGAVGLEQAFVVSHDVALLDALPHRILIERSDDGVSTVKLEGAC